MSMEISLGQIQKIWRYVEPGTIVQGQDAWGRTSGCGCTGGNGTYRLWDSQVFLYAEVYVNTQNRCVDIDIRDEVLARTGWQRLTEQRIQRLNDANQGKDVTLERWNHGEWQFTNLDQLDYDV